MHVAAADTYAMYFYAHVVRAKRLLDINIDKGKAILFLQ
jgi:hypothetical protein